MIIELDKKCLMAQNVFNHPLIYTHRAWSCIALNFLVSSPHPQRAPFAKVRWMFQWSPSGSVLFALINLGGTSARFCWHIEETSQWKTFPILLTFVLQPSFKFWTCMLCFRRFWCWHPTVVKDTYNFLYVGTWVLPSLQEVIKGQRKQVITRQTEVFPIHNELHFSKVCAKLTRNPISPFRDGTTSYWGVQRYVNVMISMHFFSKHLVCVSNNSTRYNDKSPVDRHRSVYM